MINFYLVTRSGEEFEVKGHVGCSLMEAIEHSGKGDLAAICGGCCSCGTCHVYIQSQFLPGLPAICDYERDLLECSPHQRQDSRLSCQVQLTEELSDMRVTIAPED
ncbi:2Fe-2S iron-sulfur cluster-binding protein [Kineobactrum salinum]|uniref:2Fe-2S iron-sulfur cluster binding domain-containing protein n=1 Tax=Kineobactrum salinum TaxID=2708301 RepID=A0A6C0U186_9GAMM|nr:2Fe-2S iron-sulfur cluster binding domain-containing protein [Kineobactrum salinum]